MGRRCIWDLGSSAGRLASHRNFGAKTRSCSTSFSGSAQSGASELDGISGGLHPCLVTRAANSVLQPREASLPSQPAGPPNEMSIPSHYSAAIGKDSMQAAAFQCTWLHRHLAER
ncbi:hypothetical protein PMIN02_009954 [Paraphaeosphaeria minitans]